MAAALGGIEARIHEELVAGRAQVAATLALKAHGDDVRRFLVNRLMSKSQGEEAYLDFAERFWRGLSEFQWNCELRIWMFALARAAASDLSRREVRRREVACAPGDGAYPDVAAETRPTTAVFLQTGTKNRLRELRRLLSDEEQTLLILRVNRGLSWSELAVVMGVVAAGADELELERAAARMRTRFQTAKARLRKLVEAEGLLEPV